MKNKKIIIAIIAIAIILVGVGIALCFIPNTPTKTTPTKTSNEERIKEPVDTVEYSKIKEEIYQEISNANFYLNEYYPIEDMNKLSNENKTKYLLDILLNSELQEVDVKQIKEEATKHFDSFEIYKRTIKKSNNTTYEYKNNKFIKDKIYGEQCNINYSLEEEIASKEDWIVKSKIYYTSLGLNNEENLEYVVNVYKTKKDCLNNKNAILNKNSSISNLTEEEYKELKDKLSSLTYTFINKDNNYILQSIK